MVKTNLNKTKNEILYDLVKTFTIANNTFTGAIISAEEAYKTLCDEGIIEEELPEYIE